MLRIYIFIYSLWDMEEWILKKELKLGSAVQ
jgi:hypothetical protein